MSRQPVVKQDEDAPVAVEIIASSIVAIADGFKKVLAAGLTEEAIVLLVWAHTTNVGKPAIRAVLQTLPRLAEIYTTKGKARS